MNQLINLKAIDFLVMIQNGTVKVLVQEDGTVNGLSVADEIIQEYDGFLVALNAFTNALGDMEYNVIKVATTEPSLDLDSAVEPE